MNTRCDFTAYFSQLNALNVYRKEKKLRALIRLLFCLLGASVFAIVGLLLAGFLLVEIIDHETLGTPLALILTLVGAGLGCIGAGWLSKLIMPKSGAASAETL